MSMRLLVCLDDLAHSLRIARYIAKAVNSKADIKITLFHCIASRNLDIGAHELELSDDDKVRIDGILDDYYKDEEERFSCQDVYNSVEVILEESGINKNNIKSKLVVEDIDVAAAILREAYNNHHDTIVIGKRRKVKLPITQLGTTAEKVLVNAVGKTVWLVSIARERG